ncbi:hypothetical protein GGR51DRAFT_536514 [Nemania sp. FL0031]|nr:hypothetical protein GGR51DRAFT_536514 [Nemania sp. FL0031]
MRELSAEAKAAYAANPAFEKAAETEVKQLLKKPNNDEQLRLYGLYKTGCNEDLAKAREAEEEEKKKRSIWNKMEEKKAEYKLTAWAKVLEDDGLTPEQAQEKYIAFVAELKEKYGFDPDRVITS